MREFGVDSTLTPGGGGVFDVIVDGKTLFSKKSIGRFPETGEVVSMIQKR